MEERKPARLALVFLLPPSLACIHTNILLFHEGGGQSEGKGRGNNKPVKLLPINPSQPLSQPSGPLTETERAARLPRYRLVTDIAL